MEVISLSLGINWISKLYKKLRRIQKSRRKELNELNDVMIGDPLDLAKYYVEPNCQEKNPEDYQEVNLAQCSEPIFKKITGFIKEKSLDQPGSNQMFVLSDTGMGKTSLLVMLKLLQITKIWYKNPDFILKVIGKNTIDEINAIKDKRETVLLVDALEEDPKAYGQVVERMLEILRTTQNFFKVIITCRTQFFPEFKKGPFERPGEISVGGYVCYAIYLSPFDEDKIRLYLKKRFPLKKHFFKQKKRIKKAKQLIKQMGSLQCRPMLLAHIDKLMDSPLLHDKNSEYNVYKALVDSWLSREEAKNEVIKEELFKICENLAIKLSMIGTYDISEKELKLLIADLPDIKYVTADDIKGRSLLNRNSKGQYRFSHHSIQEYLVAKHCIENPNKKLVKIIPMTNLIAKMLITNGKFKECQKFFEFDSTIFKDLNIQGKVLRVVDTNREIHKGADLKGVNFQQMTLIEADLEKADLQVANFEEVNLKNANLSKANLLGANLQSANLERANLNLADLSWADLKGVNLQDSILTETELHGANLIEANFNNADLHGAYLKESKAYKASFEGANLSRTNFQGADLRETNFYKAKGEESEFSFVDFQKANLRESIFQESNFEATDLREADLRSANFKGSKFQGTNFEGTDLRGADFKGANLQESIFNRAKFENADFEGANFQGANFLNVNFQGANFCETDFSGANLIGINLRESKLKCAILEEANLSMVNLQRADLRESKFKGAILEWADLSSANLQNADLRDTNLKRANLENINLANAILIGADLSDAKNITSQMLIQAESLFNIKGVTPKVIAEIMEKKPMLFEEVN
jgi:uncharacterized protein YjbI with pentapeptide repeats